MLFSEALKSLPSDLSDTQVSKLYADLRDLDSFFNDNYEEGNRFANTFVDKFSKVLQRYGFDDDAEEAFLDTLYEVDGLKSFAMNIIITIRNVADAYDFCEYTYEKIMMDMRGEDF